MTPIFAILGPIFRCSKSIPCRSKSDRSRRFFNKIWILIAQNVALVPYVHLPHDRAVLHKYFVEKISENPKSKSVRFIVPLYIDWIRAKIGDHIRWDVRLNMLSFIFRFHKCTSPNSVNYEKRIAKQSVPAKYPTEGSKRERRKRLNL